MALVTGASRGICRVIAVKFAREPGVAAMNCRKEPRDTEEVATHIRPGKCFWCFAG